MLYSKHSIKLINKVQTYSNQKNHVSTPNPKHVSRCLRYDTISTYVTLISSLLLNQLPHQQFCGTNVYDTSYDTSTIMWVPKSRVKV